MDHQRNEIEIDLREIFYVLKKRILIILLTAMLFVAGAGIYSFFIAEPIYESSSKLYIVSQTTSITSLADIQVGSSLALDYIELIQSRSVVEKVIADLDLDMDYQKLLGMMTVTNPVDTRIIDISIQNPDAALAAKTANDFSKVARKQISDIMKTEEPTVFETAQVPNQPVKPEKMKNMGIALLLGLFLSALVIIIKHILNDTIKNQDDIERYLGLNTLATVPYDDVRKKEPKRKRRGKKR